MKIVVGSDHAGFPMKGELLAFLREHFKIGDELRRKNLFTNYQGEASRT